MANKVIYTVIIEENDDFEIDSNITLFQSKKHARKFLETELEKTIKEKQPPLITNQELICNIDAYKSFWKSGCVKFKYENHDCSKYKYGKIRLLTINDAKAKEYITSNPYPKLFFELLGLYEDNTYAQVQLNKALTEEANLNIPEKLKALKNYKQSLYSSLSQVAAIIKNLEEEDEVWVFLKEGEEKNNLTIRLFSKKENADKTIKEAVKEILTNDGLSPKDEDWKNAWETFSNNGYETFEYENRAKTHKEYVQIRKMNIRTRL